MLALIIRQVKQDRAEYIEGVELTWGWFGTSGRGAGGSRGAMFSIVGAEHRQGLRVDTHTLGAV